MASVPNSNRPAPVTRFVPDGANALKEFAALQVQQFGLWIGASEKLPRALRSQPHPDPPASARLRAARSNPPHRARSCAAERHGGSMGVQFFPTRRLKIPLLVPYGGCVPRGTRTTRTRVVPSGTESSLNSTAIFGVVEEKIVLRQSSGS